MIELKNVKKTYKMDDVSTDVLKGISLTVRNNKRVAIMGPSGSGKSTMLHIMGCLDKPTSGSVVIDGEDISDMSDDELAKIRREKIGFIFQFFYLLPSLTAKKNVMLPMSFNNVPRDEQEKRASELLTMVGLGNRMNHFPSQLSGGERQRVAIARSLANNPSIVLADEPTGALDSKTGKEIIDILNRLYREQGVTLVMITHDANVARNAEDIICIKDGEITKKERCAPSRK
ncbi:MAG: ABC transporter ATP-binding protein [Candidatus Aenigmarchaeota archaeon]|nr:ABC transporter ATP-binding protein [Candidatus Aenigmarchaeota archaeon]